MVWTWRRRGAIFYGICVILTLILTWDLLLKLTAPRLRTQPPKLTWVAATSVLCGLQPLLIAASAESLQASDGFCNSYPLQVLHADSSKVGNQ